MRTATRGRVETARRHALAGIALRSGVLILSSGLLLLLTGLARLPGLP